MKIYLRKDLGMRRGKRTAQAAHAAMKLVLHAMEQIPNGLEATGAPRQALLQFFEDPSLSIEQVDDATFEARREEALDAPPAVAIVEDHGRTEFHGQLTVTAMGVGDPRLHGGWQRTASRELPRFAKQLIVIHRRCDAILSKDQQIEIGALASLMAIADLWEDDGYRLWLPIPKGSPLEAWLVGPFAKITLGFRGEQEQWLALREAIEEQGISIHGCHPDAFATAPTWPEDIDPITRSLKLL